MNASDSTTCPYCGEPLGGVPHRKQKGASEVCRKAYNRDRLRQFHAKFREANGRGYVGPSRAAGKDYAACYEHECPTCGKIFKNHKDKPSHCSVECWRGGIAERQRQKMLPILHPGPYSVLPENHPAVQRVRLWIVNRCQVCGVSFVTPYIRHATCGSGRCLTEKKKVERRNRRAYESALTHGSRAGVFTASQWGARLRHFKYRCAYCGSAEHIEIEHMMPLGRGGQNTIENVVPACRACNQEKGVRTLEEWFASNRPRARSIMPQGWDDAWMGVFTYTHPAP